MRKRAPNLPGAALDAMLLELLAQGEIPHGAYQLISALRGLGCDLPAMSVYRGLDRLMSEGRIEKVALLTAYRIRDRSEAVLIICENCGRTISRAIPVHHAALRRHLAERRFTATTVVLEVSGLCARCRLAGAG